MSEIICSNKNAFNNFLTYNYIPCNREAKRFYMAKITGHEINLKLICFCGPECYSTNYIIGMIEIDKEKYEKLILLL